MKKILGMFCQKFFFPWVMALSPATPYHSTVSLKTLVSMVEHFEARWKASEQDVWGKTTLLRQLQLRCAEQEGWSYLPKGGAPKYLLWGAQ